MVGWQLWFQEKHLVFCISYCEQIVLDFRGLAHGISLTVIIIDGIGTLKRERNGRLRDDIFEYIFLNKIWIFIIIQILPEFALKGPIENHSAINIAWFR